MIDNKNPEDMSVEELEAYEQTLLKEKKLSDLKKIKTDLDAEKAEKARLLKEVEDVKNKETWQEEYFTAHPEHRPVAKIPDGGESNNEGEPESDILKYYNSYKKRNDEFESRSQYVQKRDEADKTRFQIYEDQQWKECGLDGLWGNTSSDSGCDDSIGDWSPDDVYAKAVWETFVCTADLLKICVKGISINPGNGLGVQIRAFGSFGDPTSLGACECASCASITFTTYSLTLAQYNLEAIVCDKDIWDVGSILMDSYLKSMANSWAQWFDKSIYAELETAAAGTTETLTTAIDCTPEMSGSCCSDVALLELYNAMHALVASMREGANPYNPDYILISPTVAAIFKRMQTPTPMPWMGDIRFDDEGRLKKWAGLKVIEYCGANSCTDLAEEVVAIAIDSRRAVGCVFGQRPKTYKFFQTNCNSYRIDQWAYVAFGELDLNAIGHVINPA